MIKYEDICKEYGYNPNKIIQIKRKYYGYKDGNVKEFDTEDDVKKYSHLYDSKVINQYEIDNDNREQKRLIPIVEREWEDRILKYFSEYNPELVKIVLRSVKYEVSSKFYKITEGNIHDEEFLYMKRLFENNRMDKFIEFVKSLKFPENIKYIVKESYNNRMYIVGYEKLPTYDIRDKWIGLNPIKKEFNLYQFPEFLELQDEKSMVFL